jgi:hypothetical protein
MAADSPITSEIQSIKTKAAGPDIHAALQEVQADWHNHANNKADLEQFSQQLQASGALPSLALEYGKELLTAPQSAGSQVNALDLPTVQSLSQSAAAKGDAIGQMMFGQLATDWDKNKDSSGKLTAAQIDVDLKAGTDAGAATTAGGGQPAAANTEAAFTRGIKAKEGPYQPIAAAHPDWNPHQVLDAAHKVKAALGQDHVYRQGEQLRMNADGSVTSRLPDRHTPGNFLETDMKDGKKLSERAGDAKGNWTKTTFGDDGKPTGSTEHVQQADGSFTETNKGADGKPTDSLEHKVNADGTTDDTKKGADGSISQVVHTNADKSTVTTVYDPQNPGSYTETHAGPDGKVTGSVDFKKNADNSTDSTEKDASGNPTKSVHTNSDGSTATVDYKDGKPVHETDLAADKSHTEKTMDPTNPKSYSSITYDKAGNQVAGDKGDANGDTHKWSIDAQGNNTHVDVVNGVQTTKVNAKDGHLVSTQIVTHEDGKIVTVTKVPGQPDKREEQPEVQTPPTPPPTPAPSPT